MPTFYDPVADAEEASQALRGLAHASRSFEHPEDAYGVIGDLLAGVRSMQQSIEQIAQRHRRHEGRAFDDAGDQAAGIRDAQVTADQLASAAASLDAVEERLNAAMQAAGRIAWHPASTTNGVVAEAVQSDAAGDEAARESRWVNIVFLQGDEADEVLRLIDRDGPDAAIEHLAHWDYGDETTAAAMENGYVYDTVPTGMLDTETVSGDYTLTSNPAMGHVGLYRQHSIPPEDSLDAATPTPAPVIPTTHGADAARSARASGSSAARGRKETGKVSERGSAASATDGSWFTHPGVAAVRRDRGLGR
ncbi:hypothetical protein J4H92_14545 [Leucobacter weissii]|uniref:Uncharacterized protein n=1 Tax=Leucobacter weissii TaxID=1983706 RepID=A0A939SD77_9MICO|nr:hypothetical protein [Leucobacter weissii]MBO1903160.1 hypothetical protein [Leucobacter weissii]